MQFTTLLSLYSIALSLPTSDVETGLTEEVVERSVSAPSGPVKLCFMCGSSCGGSCGCGGCGGCDGSTSTGCSSSGCSGSSDSSGSSSSSSTTCTTGDCTGDGPVIIGSHGPSMMAWSHAAVRWRQEHAQQVQRYAQQHATELVGQHVANHASRFLDTFRFKL